MTVVDGLCVLWWEYEPGWDTCGGVAFYKDVAAFEKHKKSMAERDSDSYFWRAKITRDGQYYEKRSMELTAEQHENFEKAGYIWIS